MSRLKNGIQPITTKDGMLDHLFTELSEEISAFDPPELENDWEAFTEKYIDNIFPGKEHFREHEDCYTAITSLLWDYERNAFEVGFNTALELMKKGAATV